jgi:energy-coupling factor transporter ATP-binding protein EcfA2
MNTGNMNSNRIEILFYMYHYRKSMDERQGKDTSEYSTPPWDLLNHVFDISGLPFEIDNPSHILIDFDINQVKKFYKPDPKYLYSLKLNHKGIDAVIDFDSISGGEKVITSLAFLHYLAEQKGSYKKLLLMDEPDAHLHPSLTKQFLDVVDKFLIKRYDAKVIMTTHSPSTVGLCDESAIFIMEKGPTNIKKQTRPDAINYLTSGLPMLSSIIDNRRYVFVEDNDDVTFYTRIYNLYKEEIDKTISLVFIPVSTQKNPGGCSVVREWSKKLRTEGMNLFKGIIDRDKSNTPNDGVVVLNRYSIENYFLDPILIVGFLVHYGIMTSIRGIEFPGKNCNKLETLTLSELQSVVDYIVNEIELNDNTLSCDECQKTSVTLKNNMILSYPKWVFNRRGHDLEAIFRKLFPNKVTLGLRPLLDIQERLPDFIDIELIKTLKGVL